jgi:hypothetical protein
MVSGSSMRASLRVSYFSRRVLRRSVEFALAWSKAEAGKEEHRHWRQCERARLFGLVVDLHDDDV